VKLRSLLPDHGRARVVTFAAVATGTAALLGLGGGEVAAYARAAGAGAAAGLAIAVLFGRRSRPDEALAAIVRDLPVGWFVIIASAAIAGAYVNWRVQVHEGKVRSRRDSEARVAGFITGQGIWLGRPEVVGETTRIFAGYLRAENPSPENAPVRSATLNVKQAVAYGARREQPINVRGRVCTHYALGRNELTAKLGFDEIYRVVTDGGRDEIQVAAPGPRVDRGTEVVVTGDIAASGRRRDVPGRGTVLLFGTRPPTVSSTARVLTQSQINQLCNTTTG
jgi:hypothetical protein